MRGIVVVLAGVLLVVTGPAQEPKKDAPDFARDVLPIFEAKCLRCHGATKKDGRLDMRTVPALLKGGASGPAIVPGQSDKSLMVELMHYKEMPPKKEKMPVGKDELDRIKAWIDSGAK